MYKRQLVTLPGYEVVDQPYNLDDYAQARAPEMPEMPVAHRRNWREVELGLSEQAAMEECKRCLRCDLEWLEEMGLALEPVPERQVAEIG